MTETNTTNSKTPAEMKSKDGLALVLGGIFILGLFFAAYTYFNRNDNIKNTNLSSEETNAIENLNDISSSTTNRDDKKSNTTLGTETIKPTTPVNGLTSEGTWVANNYKSGDITGHSYTVVKGDTLWEIAEAVYGSGTQWHKILDANSSSIGYLPNGSQALIVRGQVLVLP